MCVATVADDGDTVACEYPCYRGALALFRATQAKTLPISSIAREWMYRSSALPQLE